MSIHAAIKHSTGYTYDRPVTMSPQIIRLRPAPHTRTGILSYSLKITPENHFINWQQDPFGNYLARVVFQDQVREFKVDVEVVADMKVINPFDFFLEESATQFPFTYEDDLKKELKPYLKVTDSSERLERWVKNLKPLFHQDTIDFLVAVNQKLYKEIEYTIRMEPGVQTPDQTLRLALGSCRDSAWLLVQAMRHLGIAARFASGYLIQLTPDKESVDGPSGPVSDFTDLHAWCEVYLPGAGWVGLDATSGLFVGEGHIPLCCTPEPSSASPITGFTSKAEVEFSYSNNVYRIHEDPRVTKPYADKQWEKVLALGEYVDEKLAEGDVRLTMGGEPTFVSTRDMESEQWNTDADGADKRNMAFALAGRLGKDLGQSNPLLHIGQGKWYPGEPVPRWEYGVYWRKDGLPLVKNPEAFGDPNADYGYTFKQAEGLMREIVGKLGLPHENIEPAYEDVYYYLWKENQLPLNIDPMRVNMDDSLDRKTLSNVLRKGLNNPVGFALPLKWEYSMTRWLSCAWEFRNQHMYLIPGNSPMGLRMPLDTLPYMVPAQRPQEVERSPFESVGELPDFHQRIEQQQQSQAETIRKAPEGWLYPKEYTNGEAEEKEEGFFVVKKKKEKEETTEPTYRTYTIKQALSVEARDGKLYVFFPPIDYIEQYLELLAIVEAAAERLSVQIIVEGYAPPRDNRIEKLVVTPDPGVIEVNIHPAKSWQQVMDNYSILFENAAQTGLGTEKFMLDGRHIGSGGGHHITLGGTTPADSPILRRPDMLKSFILFWQNHPGLSYLFSSAFIGPTSQAPRIDEGKADHLYELEIALEQIQQGGTPPYWVTDRLLRNFLVDLTGNTHRAEFCIDKLYSPDSSTGRLGILELRAFEMPPDEKMCLIQLLLIRTLTAWFWHKPYPRKLVRWGTELHDKYMLHHYVKEDLLDICEQLQADGYFFDAEWLEPFFEFRFPMVGRIQHKGMTVTLRTGIEPWQVLGEEMSSAGTARFVDSSVERLEIKVTGLNPERYAILCNEQRIPLQPTGRHEEYVAGIRYKAWAPPSALHPTLPVDTPLVFDIYDLWNQKSIGGCTYHVSHPGGRGYEDFPVNSYAAESRRESRFFDFGHTQGEAEGNKYGYGYDSEEVWRRRETPASIRRQDARFEQEVPKAEARPGESAASREPEESRRYINTDYKSDIKNVPMEEPTPNKEFPYTFDLRRRRG